MALNTLTRGLSGRFNAEANAVALKRMEAGENERPRKRQRTDVDHAMDADAVRKANKIKIQGDDVQAPVRSFEELQKICAEADERLLEAMAEHGFLNPTPCQMQAIPIVLAGRDLLCCSPTGSGKTLSFILPLLCRHLASAGTEREHKNALIVVPTRELAKQVFRQAVNLGKTHKWKVVFLGDEKSCAMDADVIVATPLKLVFALKSKAVDLKLTRTLIMDEADKLFEDDFLEQIDKILSALADDCQKAMFSATIPSAFEQLAKKVMRDDAVRIICGRKDAAAELIKQELFFCANEEGKLSTLKDFIKNGGLSPPALVFLQSVERAKDLCKEMQKLDLHADAIHSEKSKDARDQAIEKFAAGETWLLVTTDVMARGIDFRDVNLVICYDVPPTAMAYIHRVGRTGRNGRPGRAITFFTNEDAPALKGLVNIMRNSGCNLPEWMLHLKPQSKKVKKMIKEKPLERQPIRHSHGYQVDPIRKNRKRKSGDGDSAKANSRKIGSDKHPQTEPAIKKVRISLSED